MFVELRIGDISHPPLSSCGRVIGEPWKSKILMKGLPYTYRTWSREMWVKIRWIRNHSQIQFPVKNSEPPRNFGTGGRRNSQNKRCVNGTKDINRWSFRCTMSQSWSALSNVPKYIHVLSFKKIRDNFFVAAHRWITCRWKKSTFFEKSGIPNRKIWISEKMSKSQML